MGVLAIPAMEWRATLLRLPTTGMLGDYVFQAEQVEEFDEDAYSLVSDADLV